MMKISKTPDGQFVTESILPVNSVSVVAHFPKTSAPDFYFRNEKTQQKFYVVSLAGPTPVDIGLLDSEAWRTWVWCWESIEEEEEAAKLVPDTVAAALEQLVPSIQAFIQSAIADHERSGGEEYVFSMDEAFGTIGYEIYIQDFSDNDRKCRLEQYKRLQQ